jgi:hypothetical protein
MILIPLATTSESQQLQEGLERWFLSWKVRTQDQLGVGKHLRIRAQDAVVKQIQATAPCATRRELPSPYGNATLDINGCVTGQSTESQKCKRSYPILQAKQVITHSVAQCPSDMIINSAVSYQSTKEDE